MKFRESLPHSVTNQHEQGFGTGNPESYKEREGDSSPDPDLIDTESEQDFLISIPDTPVIASSNNLEKDVSTKLMLKKTEVCRVYRGAAHTLLSGIGKIDPFINDIKMKRLQHNFENHFQSRAQNMIDALNLGASGLSLLPMGKLFRDFWDEQGVLFALKARLNKIRMGELEHAFVLKTLAHRIEATTVLLEGAESVNELRRFNNAIKLYLRVLVEWDNEYKRLYQGIAMLYPNSIMQVYDALEETTHNFDRVLIVGKATLEGGNNEEMDKERELSHRDNRIKNALSEDILEAVHLKIMVNNTNSEINSKSPHKLKVISVEALNQLVTIVSRLQMVTSVTEIRSLINEYRGVAASINFIDGNKELLRIEEMIDQRSEEIF